MKIMKLKIISLALSLFLLSVFFLGMFIVQGKTPNNVVPMNDETQACRGACGLGEGRPSGDFYGYDSANECLNNCFAAKGIGNVEGSCNPNTADNCCNAFAAPGQDPDCFGFNSCFTNFDEQRGKCTELGGIFEYDNTCAPFIRHTLAGCISEFDISAEDCVDYYGGTVEETNSCSSGQGCFINYTLFGRCVEYMCPDFGDTVEILTISDTTGDANIKNLADNRLYSCSLIYDLAGDSFSCKTDVTEGQVLTLVSLGLPGGSCQDTLFNIGTNTPSGCVWRCGIVFP